MKKDIKSEAYENFLQEFKKLGLLKQKQASVSKPIPKDLDAQILDFCERLRANSFSKYAQEIEQNYLEYKGLSTKLQVLIKKNMGEDKHQPETKIVGLPTVDEAKVLSPAEKQRLTAQKILGKPLSQTKSKKEDSLMVMDNTNESGEPQLVSTAGLFTPPLDKFIQEIKSNINTLSKKTKLSIDRIPFNLQSLNEILPTKQAINDNIADKKPISSLIRKMVLLKSQLLENIPKMESFIKELDAMDLPDNIFADGITGMFTYTNIISMIITQVERTASIIDEYISGVSKFDSDKDRQDDLIQEKIKKDNEKYEKSMLSKSDNKSDSNQPSKFLIVEINTEFNKAQKFLKDYVNRLQATPNDSAQKWYNKAKNVLNNLGGKVQAAQPKSGVSGVDINISFSDQALAQILSELKEFNKKIGA